MHNRATVNVVPLFRAFAKSASVIVTLVGGLALTGWILNISPFKSILPGLATMKANTALSFLLSGIALWLLWPRQPGPAAYRTALVCAGIVALIGLLTLSEYLFAWNPGIDQLLFRDGPESVGVSFPGRMAPSTALGVLLAGLALLWLPIQAHAGSSLSQILAIPLTLLGLLTLIGISYDVPSLYRLAAYNATAAHTAFALVLLGLGILFTHPDRGPMAQVSGEEAGGIMARRLLLAVFLLTPLLGWLRLRGEALGLYDTQFGVALVVTAMMVGFAALIWWNAASLNRIGAERDRLLERLQLQLDRMPVAYLCTDAELRYIDWNPAAERIFGYTREEVLGKHPFDLIVPSQSREYVGEIFRRMIAGEMEAHGISENVTRDGRTILCEWMNTPIMDAEGKCIALFSMAQDITERKSLEEQLHQAQKMEGIGQLAGGIAHDFNNLLTAILGYAEFATYKVPTDSPVASDLQHIEQAAMRAADLTRQLLAFARRQVIQPRIIDLNDLVLNLDKMLRRLIGEDIELVTRAHADLWPVKVDPGQIEQVLVNLAVNARDAMPEGGKLTLETGNVILDADYARGHVGVEPGEYVMMAVTDTGVGMSEEVLSRIFEPFFTTKETGKGTGLGLATVYGIVKQSGGDVWVYSEPGHGTTFKVYLPRVPTPAESLPASAETEAAPRGTETILVVEDEASVRATAVQALRALGYTVLEAGSGEEALVLAVEYPGEIHLLVTDVVMPQMSGKTLTERLRKTRPGTRVLYASGYTDNTIVHHGVLDPGILFLQKPFTPLSLARKVREALGRLD